MGYINIKEAALKVFAKKGFDGTTVKEIAAESGLKPSSIYSHFSSKEELFMIIWEECMKKASMSIKPVTGYVEATEDFDAKEVLNKHYNAIISHFTKNREDYLFLKQASLFANAKETMNNDRYSNFMINSKSIEFYERFFSKLKSENRIINESNENLFYTYIAAMLAYLEQSVIYNIPLDKKFADRLWEGFWKSIEK
ncbi:TetR/AcrR family transcriptional regulator [Clostridium folliculivorans]|uniref:HTH tetR-type domain-containing protein n=1 Tax=Clostridium folliculivorans TaxID=2886038 RepID=A0A9W5Y4U6_9CLOT|nr:TetR/AcrR family transcriptional regulator [Clostridium folliculivorans]GKU26766.1 hypothetical protein CFOLD11_35930 [Clostridium folliculivorans]GKU31360.1 hypothetical protein CFB3_34670 [Clostridium folliculivorans]